MIDMYKSVRKAQPAYFENRPSNIWDPLAAWKTHTYADEEIPNQLTAPLWLKI